MEVVAVHRLARVTIELLAYEQALGESERKKTEKRREPMRTKERIPFLRSPIYFPPRRGSGSYQDTSWGEGGAGGGLGLRRGWDDQIKSRRQTRQKSFTFYSRLSKKKQLLRRLTLVYQFSTFS